MGKLWGQEAGREAGRGPRAQLGLEKCGEDMLSGSEARQPLLHGSQLSNEGLCDGFPVLHALCA